MDYRLATERDIHEIARLHALSWQTAYRGLLSDNYLNEAVLPERLAVWKKRLKQHSNHQFVVIAEDNQQMIGFACAFGGADNHWGTLLDNLHVHPSARRQGVGRRLMQKVAKWVLDTCSSHKMHLFVFADNKTARSFYENLRGKPYDSTELEMPGGERVPAIMYTWETVASVLSEESELSETVITGR